MYGYIARRPERPAATQIEQPKVWVVLLQKRPVCVVTNPASISSVLLRLQEKAQVDPELFEVITLPVIS